MTQLTIASAQLQVTEFMMLLGYKLPTDKVVPPPFELQQRLSLLLEEYHELMTACFQTDHQEMVDACTDLLYILLGFFALLGVDAESAFQLVHKSNMTKVFPDGKIHFATDSMTLGKAIKPDTFRKPDLDQALSIAERMTLLLKQPKK